MRGEIARVHLRRPSAGQRDVQQEDREYTRDRQRQDEADAPGIPGHAPILDALRYF